MTQFLEKYKTDVNEIVDGVYSIRFFSESDELLGTLRYSQRAYNGSLKPIRQTALLLVSASAYKLVEQLATSLNIKKDDVDRMHEINMGLSRYGENLIKEHQKRKI